MKAFNTETAWDHLVECGIATQAELELITQINGYTLNSLEDVLYARTGLNSFDQIEDDE